jgi:hypothetical protein
VAPRRRGSDGETRRRAYKIEIEGDRWHTTGNFFFETYSNQEKATPGCFLYTQADLVFCYFVEPHLLYILSGASSTQPTTRQWALAYRWIAATMVCAA